MNARPGHPDRARRHDQPRGAGRAGRWARSASSAATRSRSTTRPARCASTASDDGAPRGRRPISIDGFTGEVIRRPRSPRRRARSSRCSSRRPSTPKESPVYQRYAQLMDVGRRGAPAAACAPTPTSPTRPTQAIAFGAEGIGLCRTEHMFFGEGKIGPMREMILAETEAARRAALAKLLPLQRADFAGIFRGDGGPAGHDPHARSAAARVPAARRGRHQASSPPSTGMPAASASRRASRRCTSSTRCSATAAAASASSTPRSPRCRRAPSSRPPPTCEGQGSRCHPEVMIPLVGHAKELDLQADDRARRSPTTVFAERGVKVALPGRHDDRGAARRADRRRDRRRRPSSSASAPTT